MALWTMTDEAAGKPKYIAQSGVVDDVVANIYGVDTTETGVTAGVTHAGWVKRTTGSGGRSGRVFHETLVAASSMGGDTGAGDDSQYPDS
jgi:hypothetical protein